MSSSSEVAQICKEKIRSWNVLNVDRQIEVEEISCLGGSKTYKVSATVQVEVEPASVVFKFIPPSAADKDSSELIEARTMAAARAFSLAGIGPFVIAESSESEAASGKWSINEWGGSAIVDKFTGPGCANQAMGVDAVEKNTEYWPNGPSEFRECAGFLLGKIHSIPSDWNDVFVEKGLKFRLHDTFPTLGCLGMKALQSQSLEGEPELMLDRWRAAIEGLEVWSELAKREVTVHADFHCGNILVHQGATGGGLVSIDFEFASVGQAQYDLGYAYVINKSLLNNTANKRAFIKGYVKGVGAEETTIDDVLIDCELASLKSWPPNPSVGIPDTELGQYEGLLKKLADHCAKARETGDAAAAMREELFEKGAARLLGEWHKEA